MRIECTVCGYYADLEKPPLNNICPVCFSFGSLLVHKEPRKVKVWTKEDLED